MALRGELSPAFCAVVKDAALCLAGRWWRANEDVAPRFADRLCGRFRGFAEVAQRGGGHEQRLREAIALSEEPGFADRVLDPLLDSLDAVRTAHGWTSPAHQVFLRCFFLELGLIEGWLLETEIRGLPAAAGGELGAFIQSKARPVIQKALSGRAAEAEDAVAVVAQGLLLLGDGKWPRKTLRDFDRREASLAAFVAQSARYHALDVLKHMPSDEVPYQDEKKTESEAAPTPVEEGGDAAGVPMDEWIKRVESHGDKPPDCLDPGKRVGRKRLLLLEGYFLSHLADERFGAHTCPDGTWQLKFILAQGSPPALVLGELGGEDPHTHGGVLSARGRDQRLSQGFRPETCRAYDAARETRADDWLHWRILYTAAFLAAAARSDFMEIDQVLFTMPKLRNWCLRRNAKEPALTPEAMMNVFQAYQAWLDGAPWKAMFSVQVQGDAVEAAHAYPHVLLSSYATNAFCALYVGLQSGEPWSVDDVRSALKDLRQALRGEGRHELD